MIVYMCIWIFVYMDVYLDDCVDGYLGTLFVTYLDTNLSIWILSR